MSRSAGAPCDRRRCSARETGLQIDIERTSAPCSEVGFFVLGNWCGKAGFMVQAIGGAVDFGASGNWSEEIDFDHDRLAQ